jgi:hypothetical protein
VSNLITIDDLVKCAKSGGYIYATIIKDLPNNDPEEPLKLLDIDEDRVTIEYDGNEYEVDIKNVEKIEF